MVKKKARLLHVERQKTGGGPSNVKPLTDLELELLSAIGELVVHGLEDVPESFNFMVSASLHLTLAEDFHM